MNLGRLNSSSITLGNCTYIHIFTYQMFIFCQIPFSLLGTFFIFAPFIQNNLYLLPSKSFKLHVISRCVSGVCIFSKTLRYVIASRGRIQSLPLHWFIKKHIVFSIYAQSTQSYIFILIHKNIQNGFVDYTAMRRNI